MDLQNVRDLIAERKIMWQAHCVSRMQERDISRADVFNAIETGEIIEDYPDDFPHPSCLIMGTACDGQTIHIVLGSDDEKIYMITAYIPNTVIFHEDLKTRRK